MTGCPNLADDDELYCSAHKKTANYEYNHYHRDPETKKRYGRAWKRIRDRHIREHPLCEECLKHGIYKPAEEVHHKLPLADGGTHDRSKVVHSNLPLPLLPYESPRCFRNKVASQL